MSGKVFGVGVTQAKKFVNTHIKLAEFFAREDNNRNLASWEISQIMNIRYNRPDESTGFLADGIKPIYDVQIKMEIFKQESSNNKDEKSITVGEAYMIE